MSFELVGMYGVAMAALGMLGTLATCLSIDVYGPVCDNAGGIAEMSEFPESVRDNTDALDAAGNTTAAIGKGMLATPSTCAFRSEGCDAKSCGQIGQENAQFFLMLVAVGSVFESCCPLSKTADPPRRRNAWPKRTSVAN